MGNWFRQNNKKCRNKAKGLDERWSSPLLPFFFSIPFSSEEGREKKKKGVGEGTGRHCPFFCF
jgi:hypothetical protein